jgi:hypothetical protein
MVTPRMCLILSENWTMTSARDLPALVRWAREAEDAGFDAVMISEHIALGPSAGAEGVMPNPREYALPFNQDPGTPWPSSLVLLSGLVAAGRDPGGLELVGGTRAVFASRDGVADLGQALATIAPQAGAGFTTFCVKPSQFTDDARDVGRLCRDIIRRVDGMLG